MTDNLLPSQTAAFKYNLLIVCVSNDEASGDWTINMALLDVEAFLAMMEAVLAAFALALKLLVRSIVGF